MTDHGGAGLPSELKKQLRAMQLAGLRDAQALDTYEVELFAWYVRETESLFAKMALEESEFLQQQLNSGIDEPNDSGFVAVSYYARRVRYSHVIYLTSMLEGIFRRESDRLTNALGEQNVPFAASELKDDLWTARRKVLERYGHFKIHSDIWDPIRTLLNVRNILVHNNGVTDSIHPDRLRALAKIPGIGISSGELEISPSYVQSAFSAVKNIANFLEKQVGSVIENAIHPRAVT